MSKEWRGDNVVYAIHEKRGRDNDGHKGDNDRGRVTEMMMLHGDRTMTMEGDGIKRATVA